MERQGGVRTVIQIILIVLIIPRILFAASQGADAELKRLLELEAAAPDTAPGKVSVGDAYLEAAKKFPKEKAKFSEKATAFYAKAWPDLDEAWKEKMRDRFHKMAGLPATFDKPAKGGGKVKGWSIPDELWEAYLFQGFGHGGRACAQILPAGKKNEAGYTGFHSLPIPASEGKTYHVSFWALTERTDADGTCSVRFFDAAGKLLSQMGPFISSDHPWWQKIEGDFKAPAGAARVDLNFTMMAKAGATFIDDVAVELDGKNLVQNSGFEEK